MAEEISIEYVRRIADQLEVRQITGEGEHEFRQRVALTYLEQNGDPLHSMEIASGKDYHDFDEEERGLSFLFNLRNARQKNEKYKKRKDSHRNMGWEEYEWILENNKFERVMAYDFNDTFVPERVEEYGIWVRPDKGFLLTAESYWGKKSVNSSTLYYEMSWKINGEEFGELERNLIWDVLERTGNGPCNVGKEHLARTVSKDAMEGIISHITRLEDSPFQTNSPWKFFNEHHLWLCDYSEEKNRNYKQIAREKISRLPGYAQEMLGVTI